MKNEPVRRNSVRVPVMDNGDPKGIRTLESSLERAVT